MKYNQKLPEEVEAKLDAYIERIKKIKWFQPQSKIDAKDIENKVKFALDCFGLKAELEWRKLETAKDWGAARDASWDAARDAAWDAAWAAAGDAAGDAARGAENVLVEDLEDFKNKYPNGTFINLIPLWELGLYPIGVISEKFVIYVPPIKSEFPEIN